MRNEQSAQRRTKSRAELLSITIPEQGRILSAGLDVTDVSRLALAHERSGEALVERLCGEREQRALERFGTARCSGLAIAFGVKEAAIKAAGGIPRGGRFVDIDCSALLDQVPVAENGSEVVAEVAATGAIARRLIDSHVGGERRRRPQLCAGTVSIAVDTQVSWLVVLAEDTTQARP